MRAHAGTTATESAPGARLAWLPLSVGVAVMPGITLYPLFLTGRDERVDHLTTMLACWAMSAGFARGVGFVPRHFALRWLLSSAASLAALAAACMRCLAA